MLRIYTPLWAGGITTILLCLVGISEGIYKPATVDSRYLSKAPYADKHVVVFRSEKTKKIQNELLQYNKRSVGNNDHPLIKDHGFTYVGNAPHPLGNYHVMERNESRRQNRDFEDHLVDKYNADWISDQNAAISMHLREYGYLDHKNIIQSVKTEALKSLLMADFSSSSSSSRITEHHLNQLLEETGMISKGTHQEKVNVRDTLPYERNIGLGTLPPEDPRFVDQWHLHGGTYFGDKKINFMTRMRQDKAYAYLNVLPVWKEGISGKKVVIAVVDDGVNYEHLDIMYKFSPQLSINLAPVTKVVDDAAGIFLSRLGIDFSDSANGRGYYSDRAIEAIQTITEYGMPLLNQKHGTAVASIAAASANDGACGTGVAPGALISSIRVLSGEQHDVVTELQEAIAFTYLCEAPPLLKNNVRPTYLDREDINMIYVISLGPSDTTFNTSIESRSPSPLAKMGMKYCSENGRDGYGSIYVVAAGNGRGKSMQTCDFDKYVSSRYTIGVGAITHTGSVAPYSEGGCSLMLVAPSSSTKKGIVTATNQGAFHYMYKNRMNPAEALQPIRSSRISSISPDVYTDSTARKQDACTSNAGGTSAAAPEIAGIVALMMEKNPKLTWKDVQDILIRSCIQIDYTAADLETRSEAPISLELKGEASDETSKFLHAFVRENNQFNPLEWSTNEETGLHHSIHMGFGLPDVAQAVNYADERRYDIPRDLSSANSLIHTNNVHIQNDYVIQHVVVPTDAYYSKTDNAKKEKFRLVGTKNIGLFQAKLEAKTHQPIKIYDHLPIDIYDRAKAIRGKKSNPNKYEAYKIYERIIVDHVEIFVNLTIPMEMKHFQLALCDYQKVCSMFFRGDEKEKVGDSNTLSFSITQNNIAETFMTLRHWGQVNPYQGPWTILIRNNYAQKQSPIIIHEITLAIYGHYL